MSLVYDNATELNVYRNIKIRTDKYCVYWTANYYYKKKKIMK